MGSNVWSNDSAPYGSPPPGVRGDPALWAQAIEARTGHGWSPVDNANAALQEAASKAELVARCREHRCVAWCPPSSRSEGKVHLTRDDGKTACGLKIPRPFSTESSWYTDIRAVLGGHGCVSCKALARKELDGTK